MPSKILCKLCAQKSEDHDMQDIAEIPEDTLERNVTLFCLNYRFEVVFTLCGKLVSLPNVKNVA